MANCLEGKLLKGLIDLIYLKKKQPIKWVDGFRYPNRLKSVVVEEHRFECFPNFIPLNSKRMGVHKFPKGVVRFD